MPVTALTLNPPRPEVDRLFARLTGVGLLRWDSPTGVAVTTPTLILPEIDHAEVGS